MFTALYIVTASQEIESLNKMMDQLDTTTAHLDDKINEIWSDDALNRRIDAEILRRFTIGHLKLRKNAGEPQTYVLNLDANWGAGKTFFFSRFKKHLEAHNHVAIYINAWEDDHSNEPFMTVIDEIQSELSKYIQQSDDTAALARKMDPLVSSARKIIGSAILSGGKHLATRYVGEKAVEGLTELWGKGENNSEESALINASSESVNIFIDQAISAAGDEILANFRNQKILQRSFRDQLSEIGKQVISLNGVRGPIFVLIDELDRCRPSYAIELLERVKHIFSLENFVFILGTDTTQLSNAVKGVYGSEFDGDRYLRRFIDRSYSFQEISRGRLIDFSFRRNGLIEDIFVCLPNYTSASFLTYCFDECQLDARDIRQLMEKIGTFAANWSTDSRKIDLTCLLWLTFKNHFSLTEADFIDSKLANLQFEFRKKRDSGSSQYISHSYKKILARIDKQSIENFSKSEPVDFLDVWIEQKNHDELNSLFEQGKTSQRFESIVTEYSRFLDQLANIEA